MFYSSDLHVSMNGTALQWVGGCDIYEDETKTNLVVRFVYDIKPYDYIDSNSGKAICDMSEEEFEAYKENLKAEQLSIPEHAKFIADYEDAKAKGLY